jgi:hypothetical protein
MCTKIEILNQNRQRKANNYGKPKIASTHKQPAATKKPRPQKTNFDKKTSLLEEGKKMRKLGLFSSP